MNCLIRSKTARVGKKLKIQLNDLRNNGKKKEFKRAFLELLDELLNRI